VFIGLEMAIIRRLRPFSQEGNYHPFLGGTFMSAAAMYFSYWVGALCRGTSAAMGWIWSQGVPAGALLTLCVLIFEALGMLRNRGAPAAESPANWWRRYGWRTLKALLGGALIFLVLVIFVFVTSDAPEQLAQYNNPEPGPKRGPIGPILAVELSQAFATIRPCRLYFTSGEDNGNLRETLRWIAEYGGGCYPLVKAEVVPMLNADHPPPMQNRLPGIVVHWNEGLAPGEKVVKLLENFNVRANHQTFDKKLDAIWIDIGPGDPWKK
jgi:hypothetical protein